jgi:hypothetical protein
VTSRSSRSPGRTRPRRHAPSLSRLTTARCSSVTKTAESQRSTWPRVPSRRAASKACTAPLSGSTLFPTATFSPSPTTARCRSTTPHRASPSDHQWAGRRQSNQTSSPYRTRTSASSLYRTRTSASTTFSPPTGRDCDCGTSTLRRGRQWPANEPDATSRATNGPGTCPPTSPTDRPAYSSPPDSGAAVSPRRSERVSAAAVDDAGRACAISSGHHPLGRARPASV